MVTSENPFSAAPSVTHGLSGKLRISFGTYRPPLQNLQRLHINTPRSVVYFLAGTAPFEAVLHSRQLSLFLMICHLPSNPLNIHGKYILSSNLPSSCSWFMQIQELCKMYKLPPPLNLLSCPPLKKTFKKEVKLKILDIWQTLMRSEALLLSSLACF